MRHKLLCIFALLFLAPVGAMGQAQVVNSLPSSCSGSTEVFLPNSATGQLPGLYRCESHAWVFISPVGVGSPGISSGGGQCITTVSALAVCSPVPGTLATVTDGASSSDCTVGLGSSIVNCQYSGTTWAALASGGTTLTGTGLARNTGASTELSGDVTTSGSNLTSVVKVNGGSVPLSKAVVGTNGSGQFIDASSTTLANNTSGTAANLSGTPTLPNGTTATTQAGGDNSTKLATTAFVNSYAPLAWPNFNATGAASTPGLSVTGAPFAAGSATTDFPQTYLKCAGASAVTTFSTNGTMFGGNGCSGFTGNLFDWYTNGSSEAFKLDYQGNATFLGTVTGSGFVSTGGGTGFALWNEGTQPAGAASNVDLLWADSTAHRPKMVSNNGSATLVGGIAASGTSGNIAKLASNGIDYTDSGQVVPVSPFGSGSGTYYCVRVGASNQTTTSASAVQITNLKVNLPASTVATYQWYGTIFYNQTGNVADGVNLYFDFEDTGNVAFTSASGAAIGTNGTTVTATNFANATAVGAKLIFNPTAVASTAVIYQANVSGSLSVPSLTAPTLALDVAVNGSTGTPSVTVEKDSFMCITQAVN